MSLIPDFNALRSIDYRNVDMGKTSTLNRIAMCASILMIVFVFLPWFKLTVDGESDLRLGIGLWYGMFALVFAGVTLFGSLYRQHALALWASVLCAVMGIIGWTSCAALTIDGETIPVEIVKVIVAEADEDISVSHIGAMLFFFAALVATVCSFLSASRD